MKVKTDMPHRCGGVAEVDTRMSQRPVEGDDTGELGPPREGYRYWVEEGEAAACVECGATGQVGADGETAWIVWDEGEDEEDPV